MGELNVLYACDDRYAPYCGVSMFSLFDNNKHIGKITVYIVADNVSEENIEKLNRTAEQYGRQLVIIDAQNVKALMEKLGVPKYRGSYATHYRKFFQLFIPETVKKLLYLDADTIIVGSLEDLINSSLNGKCIGVVLDALGGRYKKLLGFMYGEPYFNAGVTFIDTCAWKERDYSEKLIDHINNQRAKYCNPDQDLFNIVLKGDVEILPIGYNFQPVHGAYSDKAYFDNYPDDYYTEKEIREGREKPIILHTYRFLGEFPWHKNNLHPDNQIFDMYLRNSEWKQYKKKKASVSLMFKLEKRAYTILPKALFLYFFQKIMYISFYRKNKKLARASAEGK